MKQEAVIESPLLKISLWFSAVIRVEAVTAGNLRETQKIEIEQIQPLILKCYENHTSFYLTFHHLSCGFPNTVSA
jgi:hypothetical protein